MQKLAALFVLALLLTVPLLALAQDGGSMIPPCIGRACLELPQEGSD
jgi:hypothetical protein